MAFWSRVFFTTFMRMPALLQALRRLEVASASMDVVSARYSTLVALISSTRTLIAWSFSLRVAIVVRCYQTVTVRVSTCTPGLMVLLMLMLLM